jgi:ribose transport system ATP-binding protein
MKGVQKSFGGTQALRKVDLEVAAGEVHALIGENGAGKSTLMKALSGACAPDAGEMLLNGKPFRPKDPLHARRSGIAMIYQELNLAPHLSVEENIMLGVEPKQAGFLKVKERRALAAQALSDLQANAIPLTAPIHACSIAQKQMVEIARALVGAPQILIMDEPTSSLTQVDTQNLFAAIHRLRARGVSIIYISHFLEECQQLADRYTVLRDGETVGSGEMKEAEISEIIHLMVGREMADIYPRIPHQLGQPALQVKALRAGKKPKDATFELRKGEILGIAGLIGAGRTETLRAIFGLDPVRGGSITVNGREATRSSPARRLDAGLGLLSENRKEEGLMLNRSLADNLTATNLKACSQFGILNNSIQRSLTETWMNKLSVKARSASQTIGELSGGNQQKIAIGRLLHHGADILLLDEPTRGIDVASKAQIYHLVGELAAQGKAIIFVSSYLPELLGICDSIAVMCRGVLCPKKPVSEWTESSIIATAIGNEQMPACA